MTGPATVLENAASRRLPLWPGLLLNVVLPGSGFSYLGRPWLHLLTLLVTLLTWFAAWLLVLYVGYAGLSDRTRLSVNVSMALVGLGFLLLLVSYVLLVWSYLRAYRHLATATNRLAWQRWLPAALHLGGLLLLVLPPLLGRTVVL